MTTRRPVGWHPSGVTPCHDPESFSSWRMSQGFMPPSIPPGRLFSPANHAKGRELRRLSVLFASSSDHPRKQLSSKPGTADYKMMTRARLSANP